MHSRPGLVSPESFARKSPRTSLAAREWRTHKGEVDYWRCAALSEPASVSEHKAARPRGQRSWWSRPGRSSIRET